MRAVPPRRQSPRRPTPAPQSLGPDARPDLDHKNPTTVPLADEAALLVGVDASDASLYRPSRHAHSDAATLARSEYATALREASLSTRTTAASSAHPTRVWPRAIRHALVCHDRSDDSRSSKNLTRHHHRERSPAPIDHPVLEVLLPTVFRILHLEAVRLAPISPSGRALLLEAVTPRRCGPRRGRK